MADMLNDKNDPIDLANMSDQDRQLLAKDLRETIIDRVSENGGHLSSNLGVVELTIALLSCFNPPEDQIVFDVGHQCYTYKLLTGRMDKFCSLRKKDGMSGFPRRDESDCDCFGTGHSSTSISAALGLLRAKKLSGEKGRVIAVIGDGALSGGMAYEALNDTGNYGDNLLVILNDNQMSIDKNVGAVSRHLNAIRSTSGYLRVKNRTEIILNHIPFFGKAIARFLLLIKDALRVVVRRNNPVIFEDLGFRYFGPIDGNDISLLIKKINTVKEINEPVLLHICTVKGKGYDYAEKMPSQYHGVAPFNVEVGYENNQLESFTYTFGQTLLEIANDNHRVVAVSAGMMSSTGLEMFRDRFTDRFFDVGIAEEHAITMAAGMAANKSIPVVAMYSTFLQRGYDQILHDICIQNLHVIFAIDRAGIVGSDGPTHQGVFDIAMLMPLPNMEILIPRDYFELKRMLIYAVNDAVGPVAIRYPRAGENPIPGVKHLKRIKMQKIVKGTDVVIFAVGPMVYEAYIAVKKLAEIGVSCELIDVQRVKPIADGEIESACANKRIAVVYEDGVKCGGLSSYISMIIAKQNIRISFISIGAEDHFVPAGTRRQLLALEKMDSEAVYQAILSAYKKLPTF